MKSFRPIWLLVPLLNTLQQILLKQSAEAISGEPGTWLENLAISPWFALAIAAEIACFGIWMTVLSELELSLAFPLSAISYVLIIAVAWLGYGEQATAVDIAGSVLILIGVWFLGSEGPELNSDADPADPAGDRDIKT